MERYETKTLGKIAQELAKLYTVNMPSVYRQLSCKPTVPQEKTLGLQTSTVPSEDLAKGSIAGDHL